MNEQLQIIFTELTPHGYKCYSVDGSERFGVYGFMITPSDNVLYIQAERFGGWNFSLQYKPSRQCGTGCQCLEEAVSAVTLETVQKAEKEGLQFARRLSAPLYANSAEWLRKYWRPNSLREVASA